MSSVSRRYSQAIEDYNALASYVNGFDKSVDYLTGMARIEDIVNQKFKNGDARVEWQGERTLQKAYFDDLEDNLQALKNDFEQFISLYDDAAQYEEATSALIQKISSIRQKLREALEKGCYEETKPLISVFIHFDDLLARREVKAAKRKKFSISFSKKNPDSEKNDTYTHGDREYQINFLKVMQAHIASRINEAGSEALTPAQGKQVVLGALWILKEQLKEPNQKGWFGRSDLEKELDKALVELGVNPKALPDTKAVSLCMMEMRKITKQKNIHQIIKENFGPDPVIRNGKSEPGYWTRLNRTAGNLDNNLTPTSLPTPKKTTPQKK